MLVFVIVLVVLVALFTVTCIKIVPQAEAAWWSVWDRI